ncbi:MAG TPA: cupin domain-containing protein [Solirubrobacteraceae bacterium]|nr:cupin domain-containing protein [Solirubrobacteraceae bacterium]
MEVRKVSVVSCELEEELDQNGFRHRGTAIGRMIGAERIGAAVYEADAGVPIWPYHYHYGVEEWLYVLSGAPVLRDAGGRRELGRGDLVCFPSGHLGAHTMEGPGRFIIFSTQKGPPVMSVYPDSDKLSVAPTRWGEEPYDRIMVPRDAGVDYWYGEGDGGRGEKAEVVRQPDSAPSPTVVNVSHWEGSLRGSWLDVSALELKAGQETPYCYEVGREQWMLMLDGTLRVRHPGGQDSAFAGEVLAFPEGLSGAHQLINRGGDPARALVLSTTGLPANVCYPDTGRWLMRNAEGEELPVEPSR